MSENKAAAKTAEIKTASTKASAEQAATPAENKEVLWLCEVLKQPSGELVQIGAMKCGPGAKARLPKVKADALADAGMVKVLGIV
ncbi:hypothetical protein [Rubritalea sp.]|uniref:hypothetical protein n=1 Tax=Rubritalea sp. TaxID=2109375 RepID=UPI003EFAA097